MAGPGRPIGYAAAGLLVAGRGWLAVRWAQPAPPAGATAAPGTAAVTRMNVTESDLVGGVLGCLGQATVVAGGAAVLTCLPATGTVTTRDRALYEIDGRAVPLWYGARPPWRDFAAGMSAGPDVAQLEGNLAALGFGRGLTVDEHFTAATARAISAWQHANGWPRTGRIGLGPIGTTVAPYGIFQVM